MTAIIEHVVDPSGLETSLYATGDLLVGKITLTGAVHDNGRLGELVGLTVVDQAKQSAAMDFIFFDSNPSATTFTVNAALDIADADMDRVCAVASVVAGDYAAGADNSVASLGANDAEMGKPIKAAAGGRDVYVAVVARAGPTYAAAGDLRFKFYIRRGIDV